MAEAKRDGNYVPTLMAVSNADGITPVVLYADPTTHRLLVSLSGGVTGPGSSTDNAVVRWDGTTGATVQDSSWAISDTGVLAPTISDAGALGSTTLMISDLFLASGAVINFNNGDVTITHGSNVITVAGGDLALGANSLTMTGSLAATGARVTKGWFTDIESTNMITIGGTSLLSLANTWATLQTFSVGGVAARFVNTSDSASVQVVKFEGDRATMADNDEAYISGLLSDDGGTQAEFFRLTWIATDVNVGTSLDGALKLSVVNAGSLTGVVYMTATALSPNSSDGAALGTTALMWSDLFLASGAVINFNNGNVTITHAAGALTVAGATTISIGTSAAFTTGTIELGAASDTTISRSAAGIIAVEGVDQVGTSTTQTLTNKTLTSPTITTATFSGAQQLAENASIQLDPAGSADGKYSGFTMTGVAGTTVAYGDLVYLSAVDSRWELADADAASTSGDVPLAMVLTSGNDGDTVTLLLHGNIRADAAFPALTIGAPAYVSTTAGDIQVAQPSGVDDVIRRVGFALTADELYFNPSNDYVTHT